MLHQTFLLRQVCVLLVTAVYVTKLELDVRLAQLLAVQEEEECWHEGNDNPGQDHHGGPQPDCQVPVGPHIAFLPHVWYPVTMMPVLLSPCQHSSQPLLLMHHLVNCQNGLGLIGLVPYMRCLRVTQSHSLGMNGLRIFDSCLST